MFKWIREYYMDLTGFLVLAGFLYLILSGIDALETSQWLDSAALSSPPAWLQNSSTLFLSIFIEGIPFILIGVIISSLIHVYVREDTVWRLIPKSPWVSIPFATFMGLVLPVCECGIVPVARRLIQKGFPAYIAFTFLLAAPIINPITIASTYFAFAGDWKMVFSRLLLAVGIAAVMGILYYFFFNGDPDVTTHCEHPDRDCNHSHHLHHTGQRHTGDKLIHAMHHSIFEFMDMGKYFVAGASIAAAFQAFVGLSTIREFAENEWLVILAMMAIAFGLSLCSSADAFVAASFRSAMSTPPILAFLVYGPMMDLKNLFMMYGSFRKRVVLFHFAATTLLTLASIGLFISLVL
ncbi:permease [Paludifilum halophilum]|uniref:Permease n=1 Tax=Paludifilum halophilum TaxID=1642702 RepID=A0A235B3L6_9BACL|nr:permease [Paludifilum halophilum]OYD06863.1 hypothetical protein CHM34_13030 [Paludifilum halophilum]